MRVPPRNTTNYLSISGESTPTIKHGPVPVNLHTSLLHQVTIQPPLNSRNEFQTDRVAGCCRCHCSMLLRCAVGSGLPPLPHFRFYGTVAYCTGRPSVWFHVVDPTPVYVHVFNDYDHDHRHRHHHVHLHHFHSSFDHLHPTST